MSMKKVDVYRWIDFDELFAGVRPSVAQKVKMKLYHINASGYRELCMKTEKELLNEPEVTPDVLNRIKTFLAEKGLRLNMSEKELDAYVDEEYDANHQMEQKAQDEKPMETDTYITVEISPEAEARFNERVESVEEYIEDGCPKDGKGAEGKDAVAEPKKQFDMHKELRRAFAETFVDPVRSMRPDWEWFRHQVRLDMLREQPWFVKLFVPFHERVKMAFGKADIIIDKYLHDAISRSMIYRKMANDETFKKTLSND